MSKAEVKSSAAVEETSDASNPREKEQPEPESQQTTSNAEEMKKKETAEPEKTEVAAQKPKRRVSIDSWDVSDYGDEEHSSAHPSPEKEPMEERKKGHKVDDNLMFLNN